MNRIILKLLKKIFYKIPLPKKFRDKVYFTYKTKKESNEKEPIDSFLVKESLTNEYAKYVLSIPNQRSSGYVKYKKHDFVDSEIKYIAYYLTQFHPNDKNDNWWGKGTTEWTNVSKTVPQYVGHYQPRLPGELGYYDLRLKENFSQQIALAHNYGIHAFCFYYYWFNGERLLEKPLNMFLNNKDLDIKFCFSWVNENWTKRFSGTNTDVLMSIGETEESDKQFIYDVLDAMKDERYLKINGKPVLIVYRPINLHNSKSVLAEWRKTVLKELNCNIYIIATQEKGDTCNWSEYGFDAETEFMPKAVIPRLNEMNSSIKTIRNDFHGCIYNYEQIVKKKLYINKNNIKKKVYPAVMPMWDNSARRNQNAVIFNGSTPELFYKWLKDDINNVLNSKILDDKFLFINAWNEWGEGAYLEPDRYWGYAYLEETFRSLEDLNG